MRTTQTPQFAKWIDGLKDRKAQTVIRVRIARVEGGLFGDVKSVGGGVSELRIAYGPGYRVYFTRRGDELVILLVGGDKGSQSRDIETAKKLAAQIE
ncbi:type II toxin-antitoxin system RelE/ParE family toxin [Sphingomonas sp. C8-2]|jgi:putative addiction module killer protein|nr:type II toxin-antitoxin system RelE/ParE family toxin [Sphingomonas sp. C8-2]